MPSTPRTNTPRISTGETWDIEVVGQRVFIAGTFSSLQNTTGSTAVVSQRYLASYNYQTGLIDTSFRPTFGGGVTAVEASPDGSKLYVAGSFNTVNGVTKRKIASISPTTGAQVAAFTANAGAQATALAATNTTGAVVPGFVNNMSGGIGVNGMFTVQQLKLTHDDTKLLVVHTGRKLADQDRYGVGLISTQTNQLLPWGPGCGTTTSSSSAASSASTPATSLPTTSTSWSAAAPGATGRRSTTPPSRSRSLATTTSSRCGCRVTSPTAPDPWPGLDNVGYGTGQGLAGYGLGDAVVRRDHIGALNPADGKALEWNPGSNSFEGNKAMEATARGLFVGGDGMYQGGKNTGRVAFYDFNSNPAPRRSTPPSSTRSRAGWSPRACNS